MLLVGAGSHDGNVQSCSCPSIASRRTHLPVKPSCRHGDLPTHAAAPDTGPGPGHSDAGRPGPGAAAHLLPPRAHLPRPPLTPDGYTLYPKGYRPQGLGPPPAPAASRPAAPARRLQAAAHGVDAPAGMALATVLDSAKAQAPSPHFCPPPHGGRR